MSGQEGVVQHRGYELESGAQKLRDQEAWTVQVIITKHGANATRQRSFNVPNTYPTKAEADAVALRLGRDIIDGKVPNHTVSDM